MGKKECAALKVVKINGVMRLDSETDVTEHLVAKQNMSVFGKSELELILVLIKNKLKNIVK